MLDLGLVPKDAFSKIRGIQMRFQSPPHPPPKKKKKPQQTNKQISPYTILILCLTAPLRKSDLPFPLSCIAPHE